MGFFSILKGKKPSLREKAKEAADGEAPNYFALRVQGEGRQRKEVMKWDEELTKEQVEDWVHTQQKNGTYMLVEKNGATGVVIRNCWGKDYLTITEPNYETWFEPVAPRADKQEEEAPIGDLIVGEFVGRVEKVNEMLDAFDKMGQAMERLRGSNHVQASGDGASTLKALMPDLKDGETMDAYIKRKAREREIELEEYAKSHGFIAAKDIQVSGIGGIPANMIDGKISANWMLGDYMFGKIENLLTRANVIRSSNTPPSVGNGKRLIQLD